MTAEQKAPHPLTRVISLLRAGPGPVALRWIDQVSRRWTGAPVWKLSEITPQLYVGGQHYRKGYRAMLDQGITAIVNMRREHCDIDMGIGGERHLQLATVDNTPPGIEDLRRGVDFIRAEIARGGKVYVHCAVGCGRAPTMAAAYLIATGLKPADALRQIKAARPFVHLTRGQRAVLDEFAAARAFQRP
ncbi:MAG: dual specificity protein phosphatase [Chloroflexi bacterium]|nr:dual specificity protein phosphatase [Chloroflexota bacterium]